MVLLLIFFASVLGFLILPRYSELNETHLLLAFCDQFGLWLMACLCSVFVLVNIGNCVSGYVVWCAVPALCQHWFMLNLHMLGLHNIYIPAISSIVFVLFVLVALPQIYCQG